VDPSQEVVVEEEDGVRHLPGDLAVTVTVAADEGADAVSTRVTVTV